eukprot:m.273448 g.273448  ORF g.273448 m.273448 type:complete len:1116 (+) comp40575_c1_seq38:42-3389(+)
MLYLMPFFVGLLAAFLVILSDAKLALNVLSTVKDVEFVQNFADNSYDTKKLTTSILADENQSSCYSVKTKETKFTKQLNVFQLFTQFNECYSITNITLKGVFYSGSQSIDVYVRQCKPSMKGSFCKSAKRGQSLCPGSALNCWQDVTFVCNLHSIDYLHIRWFADQLARYPFRLCEVSVDRQWSENVWLYAANNDCASQSLCGKSTKKQGAACFSPLGAKLSDTQCSSPKPENRSVDCPPLCWVELSHWSDCSGTCGCGTRQRTIQCKRKEKETAQVVDIKECRMANILSITQEDCNTGIPCRYYNHSQLWTNCSSECGSGKQELAVHCYSVFNCSQPAKEVNKIECENLDIKLLEAKTRPCSSKCQYIPSPWNDFNCTNVTSSKKLRTRILSCYRGSKELPLEQCSKHQGIEKPNETEACQSKGSGLAIGVAMGAVVFLIVVSIVVILSVRLRKLPKRPTASNVKVYLAETENAIEQQDLPSPKNRADTKAEPAMAEDAVTQETLPSTKKRADTLLSLEEEQSQRMTYAKITTIKLSDFPAHARKLEENCGVGFSNEFLSLQSTGKFQSLSIGNSQQNIRKNRFKNTVPYDEHRVVLKDIEGMDTLQADYINASFVDGFQRPKGYIACQGPKLDTCADMWRMVWGESVSAVVMLCSFMENGKNMCTKYWNDDKPNRYKGLTVEVEDVQRLANHTIRKMKLRLGENIRYLQHYHFTSWPDCEVSTNPSSLLSMMYQIRREIGPRLLVVHCSAGVGRTGVFLAILSMLDRVDAGRSLDIRGYIANMRTKRMEMVQSLAQYRFVYAAVLDYVISGRTDIALQDFKKKLRNFDSVSDFVFSFKLAKHFKLLEEISPGYDKSKYSAALAASLTEEASRGLNYLPPDSTRVILRVAVPSDPVYANTQKKSDYINASYIDGYFKRKSFIVAKHPEVETVADFWKMIIQQDSVTIVNLTEPEEDQPYWPELGPVTYGDSTIKLESILDMSGYCVRKMAVKQGSLTRKVVQFHYVKWPKDGIPSDASSLCSMMKEINLWQQQNGNPSLVVSSSLGVGRSGAFCTALNVIDQMKKEEMVDIFHMAKLANSQRPGIIPTLTCYVSIWLIVGQFLLSREASVTVNM